MIRTRLQGDTPFFPNMLNNGKVEVCLKEDVDKVIAEKDKELRLQKYNRCLLRSVIARMNATHYKDLFYDAGSEELADAYNRQVTLHYKWQKLWLALAEKFADKEEK